MFIRDFPCLALLWILPCLRIFHLLDFHYLWSAFPNSSAKFSESIMQSITPKELLLLVQALLLSLATTYRIEFSFFSCRYLDVSVPYVPLSYTALLMYGLVSFFPNQSFLIRISVDIMNICFSPQLFAAYHVLHRLLVPRHSPYALSSLTLITFVILVFNRFSILKLSTSILFQFTLFFIYIFFNVLSIIMIIL